jgi:tRNA A37 threonylcarbamoyladenosine dehydratase
MQNQFSRTQMLLGKQGIEKLQNSKVAVFGIGGVGGFAVEGLARSGVGHLALFDDDNICLTNVNRQVMATVRNVGDDKVDVMKRRIIEINPRAKVDANRIFYGKETKDAVDLSQYDYIIDAVDTVTAKLMLVEGGIACGVPVISCMGTGNKLDPTKLQVTDIYKTSICPLAKVMRRELKRRGVKKLKVVYSPEMPLVPDDNDGELNCKFNCICPPDAAAHCVERRQVPGSVAFVPSVAGMILAGEVIKDICGVGKK